MTERLLAHLRRNANRRSLALASEEKLLGTLGASRRAVEEALRALESTGTITVLAPLPFLVVKFLSWSSSRPDVARKEQQDSSVSACAHIEVPVISSSAAAAIQQREDRGAGEGEALLDEVLQVLGPEADRRQFRTILAGRHPVLIHRCLKRVQATKSIRVSRAALFRALLQRLSH
jgi:DNA-binding FadR family transcriptional regulator